MFLISEVCFNQESFAKYICFLFPMLDLIVEQGFAADVHMLPTSAAVSYKSQGL